MESELFFEGKKYISGSRASQLTGYNSDYIGQLCRRGLLDCRRVGRAWFVNEDSLKNHEVNASKSIRGKILIHTPATATPNITPVQLEKTENRTSVQLPHIARFEPKNNNYAFRPSDYSGNDFTDYLEESQIIKRKLFNELAVGVTILIFLISGVSNVSILARLANFRSTSIGERVISYEQKFANTFNAVVVLKERTEDSIAYTANVFESTGEVVGERTYQYVYGIGKSILEIENLALKATRNIRLALRSQSEQTSGDTVKSQQVGMVVVPSAENSQLNAQVKEYVKRSFSDETKILPDESGSSGVIKPIFKSKTNQEYLYVVVPLQEPRQVNN